MAITLVLNPEHLGGMTAPEDGEQPVYPVRLYMVFTYNKHTQTCYIYVKYMYTHIYLYYHLFDPSASRSNFHVHVLMNTITVCDTCTYYVPIDIPWHLFKNIIL